MVVPFPPPFGGAAFSSSPGLYCFPILRLEWFFFLLLLVVLLPSFGVVLLSLVPLGGGSCFLFLLKFCVFHFPFFSFVFCFSSSCFAFFLLFLEEYKSVGFYFCSQKSRDTKNNTFKKEAEQTQFYISCLKISKKKIKVTRTQPKKIKNIVFKKITPIN